MARLVELQDEFIDAQETYFQALQYLQMAVQQHKAHNFPAKSVCKQIVRLQVSLNQLVRLAREARKITKRPACLPYLTVE